jgi:hypothetical protein
VKLLAHSGSSYCLDGGEWPPPHGYRFSAGRTGLETGRTAFRSAEVTALLMLSG